MHASCCPALTLISAISVHWHFAEQCKEEKKKESPQIAGASLHLKVKVKKALENLEESRTWLAASRKKGKANIPFINKGKDSCHHDSLHGSFIQGQRQSVF
eukprot:1158743-Pelagomonas_calceolata.AAC.5